MPSGLLWTALTLSQIIRDSLGCTIFTGIIICIQNSSGPQNTASINGFAQTMVALSRTIGPYAGGAIWSWTSALTFPMHSYVLYAVTFLCCMVGFVMSLRLSTECNTPW